MLFFLGHDFISESLVSLSHIKSAYESNTEYQILSILFYLH